MYDLSEVIRVQMEPEILVSRRAWAFTQTAYAGADARLAVAGTRVTWHGTGVHPERGAVAVVEQGSVLEDLVGDVIRVERVGLSERRSAYVYVIGAEPVLPQALSLSRRAFMGLGLLANEYLPCNVYVVE